MTADQLAKVPLPNQLATLTTDAHLGPALVRQITEVFSPLYASAETLLDEAAEIKVTDAADLRQQQRAGELRKTSKHLRGVLEKGRVAMTADALKVKSTVDLVARTLRTELEAAESYLEDNERFAERLQAQREEALRSQRAAQMDALGCDPALHALGTMPERSWLVLLAACQGEAKLRQEEERQAKEKLAAQETARQQELAQAKAQAERERQGRIKADEQARIAAAKARAEQERLQAEKDAGEATLRKEREAEAEKAQAAALKAANERLAAKKKADADAADAKAAADKKFAEEARKREVVEAAAQEMLDALQAILEQLSKCDPADELGHKFAMNASVVKARKLVARMTA